MEPDCLLLLHHLLKRQKESTVVQTKFRSAILNLVFTFILLIITHAIRSWQRYTRSTVRKTPLVSLRRLCCIMRIARGIVVPRSVSSVLPFFLKYVFRFFTVSLQTRTMWLASYKTSQRNNNNVDNQIR